MIIELINQDQKEIEETLGKMGLSQESSKTLGSFIFTICRIQDSLLKIGVPFELTRQTYELSMMGFYISNPSIKAELNTLVKDDASLEKMIKIVSDANAKATFKHVVAKRELIKQDPVKDPVAASSAIQVHEEEPKLH